ncbi:hypothetical protein [Amycolatopsis sacchari]|uniref:hypothetical protein n=1 Tax=Amycolatopsis sacchari TaxID=115433 RepID=UPI003D733527
MRYPAGNDIEVVIEMAGRPHFMYWFVPGGREHPENALVVKDCAYIRRTPDGIPASDWEKGRSYGPVGTEGYPLLTTIDPDRPGPIETAEDVVVARFIVDARVPFHAFAA